MFGSAGRVPGPPGSKSFTRLSRIEISLGRLAARSLPAVTQSTPGSVRSAVCRSSAGLSTSTASRPTCERSCSPGILPAEAIELLRLLGSGRPARMTISAVPAQRTRAGASSTLLGSRRRTWHPAGRSISVGGVSRSERSRQLPGMPLPCLAATAGVTRSIHNGSVCHDFIVGYIAPDSPPGAAGGTQVSPGSKEILVQLTYAPEPRSACPACKQGV